MAILISYWLYDRYTDEEYEVTEVYQTQRMATKRINDLKGTPYMTSLTVTFGYDLEVALNDKF